MAIIDINSDLPKSCSKCKDPRCNIWWKVNSNEDLSVIRHKDCPLKSIDEMIRDIHNALQKLKDANYDRLTLSACELCIEGIVYKYIDKEESKDESNN